MAKLSIRSKEFVSPIAAALDQGKKLVIWHQIPWSGGAQEWFLIESIEALTPILNRGRVASAFTAYEWIELSLSRTINEEWSEQVLEALAHETPNEMLLIQETELEGQAPTELVWIGEAGDVKEYHQQHLSLKVAVGRIPNVWTGEIVRGYFPDANGVPQSGPY
jgi:hypothetical protein